MTFIDTSLLATISGTIVVLFVYVYLYVQYKEPFIGLWILSWLIHLVRIICFKMPFIREAGLEVQIIFEFLSVLSSLLLVWGSNRFISKDVNKLWLYGAILSIILSDLAIGFDQDYFYKALPTCIFIGSIYIWTGIVFFYYLNITGVGKYITGAAFILLGIHTIDYIFMESVTWFAPWGYLFDAILRFVIAVGTLLVYFEKTRQDLTNKEKYYRLFTENAVDIIFRYRIVPEQGFEYISPAVTEITGYTAEDFYNDPELIFKMIHPKDVALYEDAKKNLHVANSMVTTRIFCKNLSEIWVEQKFNLIYGENNQIVAIEGIARDVTARKMLEQDVARLDRLNTAGQMAASVAHEIRNPMTTVRGYLQLIGNKKEFALYKEQFMLVMDELDRTNSIISEYLSLSQNRVMDFKLCQLNDIIESMYPLLQADSNACNKYIKLELQRIPELYIDEKEIRQLILNLVRNGLESMKEGKELTIRTYLENEETILAIRDEGGGIAAHILDNLGKPFVTTKADGTGIGLAICYRIANRHKAKITVETSEQGTTFFICFKLSQGLAV